MKFAIVVPTYNEIGNIETLAETIRDVTSLHPEQSFSLFVVDDSSPDGTADIVRKLVPKLKTKNFSVNLIVRKEKDGLGRAYIHGFKQVLKNPEKFDYILQMDADMSHDPKYISSFVHQANRGADFVVASRYIKGGGTPDWKLYRKLLSRGGNAYARLILGKRISDYTGGYNMFSTELMHAIDIDTITSGGYGFLIELKFRALQHAKSVAEIPIIFLDREHGASKIPKSTIFKNFVLVPRIRLTHAESGMKTRGSNE